MATRTISTRLAVEGESQYKAAITSVNAELRNMRSALQMTESQFKNNATSAEAFTAKSKALKDLLDTQKNKVTALEAGLKNAQEAEAQYAAKKAELTRKIEENCKALEELKNQSGDTTGEQKRLTEENARLNAELAKNEDYLKSAKRAVNNWQTDLNKAKTAVNETENAIQENNAALDAHQTKTKANADAINALAAAMVASGLKAAIREIAEALTECVDASMEFESAMAGVKKTTNMSDAELSHMSEGIKQLSTEMPVTATELARIVEVAGQLGISKDNLLSFSKVMANLGVSTNLTSEEAATMLARFANVTKMSPELYENLGSVVVALGNNFATTESEIVEMGQRLAAAGELAGLTEPEIMAMATAMSSVGIQAEAGGTAMTQTLTKMESAVAAGGDKLAKFAEISGMSSEQFTAAWKNEPIVAIQAFIEGLGKLNERGESATLVLEEMGLSGVRQGNMLKSLATASGLLGNAVGLANTAWAENTALMTEANTRYQTTESKITMFKNSVNNLKIAVGDQLTPALGDLASKGTDVVQWATDFVQANEWLAPTISAVAASMSVLLGFITTATVVVPLLTKLVEALNTSFLKSPTALVAMGISAVTAAVVTLVATLPSATEEADALRESMDKCNESFEDAEKTFNTTVDDIGATARVIETYIDRLDELNGKTELTAAEQAEYNTIVGALQGLLPDVNIVLDETTGRLATTTEELREGAQAWKEYATQEAFATILADQTAALVDLQVQLQKNKMSLEQYYETATEGTLEYVAALEAEAAAQRAYAEAAKAANYQETDEVVAAREAQIAAIERTGKVFGQLTKDERDAGDAMFALMETMADTETQIDSQTEALERTQAAMDEYKSTLDGASETTEKMAENATSASETISTIGDGAGESAQQIPEAVSSALETTKANVDSAAPEITASVTDIGTQSAEGFKAELDTMSDSANAALSDAMQAVRGYTGEAYNSGYSVGSAISQGAAVGVRASAAQVAAEAEQMVRNAIAAAKAAAQSNSPSKKTMQLGRDLDKGLILGISELEGKVLAQMKETMGKITSVEVKVPGIPDMLDPVLQAMNGGADRRLTDAHNKVAERKPDVNVNVTQIINAENTSYAGQQREAKRHMREIARELSR